MSFLRVPEGMTRRHFMTHVAGASAMVVAGHVVHQLGAGQCDRHAQPPQVVHHAVDGGRPGHDRHVGPQARRTDRRRIQADCHLAPRLANQRAPADDGQGDEACWRVVRSMSTKEADHNRGRYYMHTGYVPNPNIEHPSYGSVVAHELAPKVPELGDSAVRVGRRRQRRSGLPGHDLGAVRRQFQRRCPRPATWAWTRTGTTQRLAMLNAIETELRRLRSLPRDLQGTPVVHRRQRTRQDPRQDLQADDQQADGSLQGRFGEGRSARSGTATPASARAA